MDGKSGLQTKNATPKPALSLSQPGILQRQCECGAGAGLSGQCEECSSKRLSGQRGMTPPALPNNPPDDPATQIQRSPLPGFSFGKLAIAPKERFGVQAKLAIGQPGDKYEQEADRVADQVMRMLPEPGSSMSRFASLLRPPAIQQSIAKEEKKKEEETLQTKPLAESITPLVQRQTQPTEEEKKKEEETLQTKTASGETPTASYRLHVMRNGDGTNNGIAIVNQEIEQRIQQERSSGEPLSEVIRAPMEQTFGVDFSSVKVHNNDTADKLNRSLSARAFTTGQDIFFRKGEYDPASQSGRGLLAHELTHVVQQGAAKLQRKPKLGQSGSSAVLQHLQTMQQKPGFDTSLYRKEIAEFQQTHSTEQIMAKQQQLMPIQNGSITQTGDRSKIFRACGDSDAAGKITHETKFDAPDGSPKTRKNVGVGEEVEFKAPNAGKWTASSGTPANLANGDTFNWTAPNRAASVTIKLEVGGQESSVSMKVIEPDEITATKDREIAYPAGQQGAGMTLNFNFHPMNVSFGNAQTREVSGPASSISGYYLQHGMPHDHNPGNPATFFDISQDNKFAAARDTAAQSGYPAPWSKGKFHWVIPNKFKVKTEGGDGKQYTTVTQAFSIEGPSGKTTITKAGESVERTP